jgi:mono/diheme cytochrome c family protein
LKPSDTALCSLLLLACGGNAPPPSAPATESAPAAAPAGSPAEAQTPPANGEPAPAAGAFAEQVKAGQALYASSCAGCHGEHGNDGKAPKVVGLSEGALPLAPPPKSKLRTTQFKTVGDVADFVVKTMPPKAPGSLSTDDYFAILAFDLKANGIDLGDKKLDAALAKTLEIPRK